VKINETFSNRLIVTLIVMVMYVKYKYNIHEIE